MDVGFDLGDAAVGRATRQALNARGSLAEISRETLRQYLICDNYSVDKRREVREWCAANQVELVFLPTYSSWLSRIECEFAALRYFARNGTDHRSHDEQDAAIGDYIRWRNQHAEPIRDFAVGSRIRRPDYLLKAA